MNCINFVYLLFLVLSPILIVALEGPSDELEEQKAVEKLDWWQRNLNGIEKNHELKTRLKGFNSSHCTIPDHVSKEIQGYRSVVDSIFQLTLRGEFKGKTFKDLAFFADKFGHRVSGSDSLEKSIDWTAKRMEEIGLVNVRTENATIPRWKRGEETAKLISPLKKKIKIIGLGFSVPTPEGGITSEAVVVKSFRDLSKKSSRATGKIVIFNSPTENGIHALIGAAEAAKHGAIAVLVRSTASFSLYTPHAGINFYEEDVQKIPTAAMTTEDADLITRMSDRGEKIVIFLKMESNFTTRESRNVFGELIGKEKPEELVLVSGHIDSWDVGQGVVDDGIGIILSHEVINVFNQLNLSPKRTIQNVAWTGEEAGLYGVRAWMKNHINEFPNYQVAMEADYGCLKAWGFYFSGQENFGCLLSEIMGLMKTHTNSTGLLKTRAIPTDIYGFMIKGVPGIVLDGNANDRYFWYHHTRADAMTALDTDELDMCLALWATTTYILADIKEKIPHNSL